MNDKIHETLTDVFCQVLEQVAFAFGEETPKEELPSDEFSSYLHCSISFKGPFKRTIEIALPSEYCEELAANTLGTEQEEVTPEMAQDALNAASHIRNFLFVGVTHFGGLGSYTVITISSSRPVVQTT